MLKMTQLLFFMFLSLIQLANSHMELIEPFAIRSKYDPANKQSGNIDYSMTSPLLADGSNFPCKGYQNDQSLHTVNTYQAGSNYTMKLAGSATHGGGSCQLSLSYDNGKTFRVIKSMIGGCPLQDSYDFQVPSSAPAGTALLAWTWVNLFGNREFYMNCAQVKIKSTSSSFKRRSHVHHHAHPRRSLAAKFENLPFIWKANVPPLNTCKTQENVQIVFPHPGADVVFGSGMSASNLATPGTCDAPSPPGPAYKNLSPNGGASEITTSSSDGSSSSTMSMASPLSGSNMRSSTRIGSATSVGSSSVLYEGSTVLGSTVAIASSSLYQATSTSLTAPTLATSSIRGTSSSSMAGATQSTSPGQAFGNCSGSVLMCLRSGQGFALCSNGQWIDMGSVAAGTMCSAGSIGYAS